LRYSKLFIKGALGIAAAAVPMTMAVAAAGPASAGPDVCVGGPLGYAYACVDAPVWVDWDDRGRGHRGHGPGHGHGHGHDH
jgi:hypothetical protein